MMVTVELFALLCAAGLGFGMGRARLCAVAATQALVVDAETGGLRLQALTISLMALLFGLQLLLAGHSPPLPSGGTRPDLTLLGAGLLALGFILNDGCYLGSVSFLGQGRMAYVFTLVGIFLSEWASAPRQLQLNGHETLITQMSFPVLAGAAGGVAFLVWLALSRTAKAAVGPRTAGVVVACLSAALIYQVLPGWNYGAAIAGLARLGPFALGLPQLAGVALFLGAIVANLVAGLWRFQPPTLAASLRCLSGGYIMQTGGQMIPGGSDTWLFWTVPGGGLHGVMALGAVTPILLAWFWVRRLRARKGGQDA